MSHRNASSHPAEEASPQGRSAMTAVADDYLKAATAKLEADPAYQAPDRAKVHRISINAANVVADAEEHDQPTRLGTVPQHDGVGWRPLLSELRARSNKAHSKPLAQEDEAAAAESESTLKAALDAAGEVISRAVTAVDGNDAQDEAVKKKHAKILETVPTAPSRPAYQGYLEGLKTRIEASGDDNLVELIPLIDAALAGIANAVAGTPGPKPAPKAPLDDRASVLALHLALGDLLRAGAGGRATKTRLGFLKQAITPRRGSDTHPASGQDTPQEEPKSDPSGGGAKKS